jgi:hypothetical protein
VTVNEDGDTCGGVSVASREPAHLLPHESDMAPQDSRDAHTEAVSGGSWDDQRVANRGPN